MNKQNSMITGAVISCIGVILIIYGYIRASSLEGFFGRLSGGPPPGAIEMVIGAILLLAGIIVMIVGANKKDDKDATYADNSINDRKSRALERADIDPSVRAEEEVLTSKLQSEPLNVDLLLKHGDVLVQCGMLQEATQEWEKVLALDSTHHTALIQMTRIYYQLGKYENAEKRLNQLSALSLTNSKETLVVANLSILVNDDSNKAISLITERLKEDSENLELLTALLEIYDTIGNLDDADKVGQKILQLSSNDFNALCVLAHAKIANGQFKEALEFTRRAKSLKPGFQNVILLENMSKLFLSKPEDSQIHESILDELLKIEDLEKDDMSNLNHGDRLMLDFVLSTTKIAMKKADRRDNNVVIDYLDSNPLVSKYLYPFIVVCYERWIDNSQDEQTIELLYHLENLYQVGAINENKELLAKMYDKAGKFYQDKKNYKDALVSYSKASANDPTNEDYKVYYADNLKRLKKNKFIKTFSIVSIVIIATLAISYNYFGKSQILVIVTNNFTDNPPFTLKISGGDTNIPFKMQRNRALTDLIWYGEYRIVINKVNYVGVDTTININFGDGTVDYAFNLKPKYGAIKVSTMVSRDLSILDGAKVFLDNTYVGRTPLIKDSIEFGSHHLKITKDFYKTIQFDFDLAVHDTLQLTYPLKQFEDFWQDPLDGRNTVYITGNPSVGYTVKNNKGATTKAVVGQFPSFWKSIGTDTFKPKGYQYDTFVGKEIHYSDCIGMQFQCNSKRLKQKYTLFLTKDGKYLVGQLIETKWERLWQSVKRGWVQKKGESIQFKRL